MSGWGTLGATRRTAPFDWRTLHRGYAYFVAERFDGSTIATTPCSEAASAALRNAPNMSRKVGVTHDGQRVKLAACFDCGGAGGESIEVAATCSTMRRVRHRHRHVGGTMTHPVYIGMRQVAACTTPEGASGCDAAAGGNH